MGKRVPLDDLPDEAPRAEAKASRLVPKDDIPEGPGELEAVGRGLAQGASLGFADEAVGGVKGLWRALGSRKKFLDAIGEEYKTARDEYRANDDAAREAHSGLFTAGELGGAVASSLVPGAGVLNVGRGARLAQALGKSALAGGVAGIGTSKAEDLGDIAVDAALGAGIGGAVGGVAHGVGRVLKRAGGKAGEKVAQVEKRTLEGEQAAERSASLSQAQKASAKAAETKRLVTDAQTVGVDKLSPEARAAYEAKLARMGSKADEQLVAALAEEDAAIAAAKEAFATEGERAAERAAEKLSTKELKRQIGNRVNTQLKRSLIGATLGGGLGSLTGEGNYKTGALLGATAGPGWLGLIRSMGNLKNHPAAQKAVFSLLAGLDGDTVSMAGNRAVESTVSHVNPEIGALLSALRRPRYARKEDE